jgi:hypothetical protein
MIRTIALCASCFSLALVLTVGSLSATPLAGTAKGLSGSAAAVAAVQKVHGCHAVCRRGGYGWHRHGPRCGRIPC